MTEHHSRIAECRVGKSRNLISVLNLGYQALTGVFPKSRDAQITYGPLDWFGAPTAGCFNSPTPSSQTKCGENYSYRSGLNKSMVQHRERKIRALEKNMSLRSGDVVLDIGSNDATSLKAYTVPGLTRVGIDPTGSKFRQYYRDDIALVADYFSFGGHISGASPGVKRTVKMAMPAARLGRIVSRRSRVVSPNHSC